MFAYEKLPGLPRERVLDAIEPVLRAYGLVGVELVWRTDGQGRVLYVTVEKADVEGVNPDDVAVGKAAIDDVAVETAAVENAAAEDTSAAESADPANPEGVTEPGQGVTLEVCSRLSRDLSTAFDVHNLFDGQYRLEVGSPGLERRLYTAADYQRFRGKLAKLKLAQPVAGQSVITGKLAGVDAEGNVLLENDDAPRAKAATESGASNAPATRAITFEHIRSGQLVVDWQEMGFSPTPRQRAGRRSAAQGRK
jgi:ribosome maturation factor RimP